MNYYNYVLQLAGYLAISVTGIRPDTREVKSSTGTGQISDIKKRSDYPAGYPVYY
jgi:hypothetical protein